MDKTGVKNGQNNSILLKCKINAFCPATCKDDRTAYFSICECSKAALWKGLCPMSVFPFVPDMVMFAHR